LFSNAAKPKSKEKYLSNSGKTNESVAMGVEIILATKKNKSVLVA
jgi:hypothetical protein